MNVDFYGEVCSVSIIITVSSGSQSSRTKVDPMMDIDGFWVMDLGMTVMRIFDAENTVD
ncbi:hypothetical protein QTP88_024270 [Uroleucon formosanum]